MLPTPPDLREFPERPPNAKVEEVIAKSGSRALQYKLAMNFGFLPMHEIYNEHNPKPLVLEWWDNAPDALAFKELKARDPTEREVNANPNFAGLQPDALGRDPQRST